MWIDAWQDGRGARAGVGWQGYCTPKRVRQKQENSQNTPIVTIAALAVVIALVTPPRVQRRYIASSTLRLNFLV